MADIQAPTGVGPVADPDEYNKMLAPPDAGTPAPAGGTTSSPGKLGPDDIQDPNKLAAKLRSSQSYVDDAQSILNDPAYKGTPLQTKQELREAINKAYDQYQGQKNTNQWLEVAQNLGQALTQFGAAQHAIGTNARFYKAPEETGINYGERTNQAFKEYNQNVGNAKDIANAGVQDWREGNELRKEKLLREEQIQNRALSQADKEAYFNRMTANDAARQAHEDARQDKGLDAQLARDAAQLRGMDLKDTLNTEKSLEQEKSGKTAFAGSLTSLLSTGDTSLTNPKDVEKLKLRLAPQAAKAGITDIDGIINQIKEQAPKINPDEATGTDWIKAKVRQGVGIDQPIDQKKLGQTIYDVVGKDIEARLGAVKAHKQGILQGGGQANSTPSSPAQGQVSSSPLHVTPTSIQSPSAGPDGAPQDSKIAQYAKQNNMDYNTAAGILAKRGYNPAQ